jgi:hypothetical protein
MEVHMTNTLARRLGSAILMLALSFAANATYHLFRITQVYSNADGTVQYVLLTATSGGQQFITGKNIKSTQGSVTRTYTFTKDLPADTAMMNSGGSDGYGGYYGGSTSYRTFLIATQGFASLGLVTPDYIVPDGFLFTSNGTINYADSSDMMSYSSLPTDGVTAMNRGGSTTTNTPQNFNGITVSIGNSDFASYEGLWLGTATNEAGWGLNLTHQGSTLFGTWFTYDTDGSGMWLVMSNGARTGVGIYTGTLYRTTGPGFSAANFTSLASSNYTQVGTLTLTFSNANTGTMSYTVNGTTQTKPISRYVYVATPPTCMLGQAAGSSPNYQDLWWRSPANSESGWGVNITHQGDILFATWFTYEAGAGTANKGLWLVMSNGVKTATGVYTGDLQRTTGPAFSAVPFNGNNVVRTTVGTGTFTFTDANTGVFSYTVNGVTQTKPITRLSFSSPATICR